MVRSVIACFLLFGVVGCGGGSSVPYTDNSQDPEALARNIKELIVNSVADARTSKEPQDHLRNIVSAVSPGTNKPMGSYEGTYAQIRESAEQLMEACERANGPTSDLRVKLDELLKLADGLPGDFKPLVEPAS